MPDEVVATVHEGADRVVAAVLGELLDAAVQVADDGLARDDLFAVELEVEAQDAVRGRMLRAHADDEVLGRELVDAGRARDAAPLGSVDGAGELSGRASQRTHDSREERRSGGAPLRAADRGRLAQDAATSSVVSRRLGLGWPESVRPNISANSRSGMRAAGYSSQTLASVES